MSKEGIEKEIQKERLRKQEYKTGRKEENNNRKIGTEKEVKVSRELEFIEEIKKEFKKFRGD